MFLQIHYLTSYHASLLNRDDAGLAKRITFGGVPRLRISSQSQKRHWREWITTQTTLPSGWRSRHFFDRIVKSRLINAGMSSELATGLVLQLAKGLLHSAGEKSALDPHTLAMKQPVLFGEPEAAYFVSLIQQAAEGAAEKDATARLDQRLATERKNIIALLQEDGLYDPVAGFEGALFGRFVTSDILARIDAPVHVAHAFTTHALDSEVDFFTVVDDLSEAGETGAAHANDMELAAGIFYGYVVIDVPLLVSNLTGCAAIQWRSHIDQGAWDLLTGLVHAIAEVTPGAKLGATAPYSRAQCVVLEVGMDPPRSLANAFLSPVRLGERGRHPMAQSVDAMATYLTDIQRMYEDQSLKRFVASLHPWTHASETPVPLPQAIHQCFLALSEGG